MVVPAGFLVVVVAGAWVVVCGGAVGTSSPSSNGYQQVTDDGGSVAFGSGHQVTASVVGDTKRAGEFSPSNSLYIVLFEGIFLLV